MHDFKILYEDEHILAVDKPRGLLTVASNPNRRNLLDLIKKDYAENNIRLRPINRLDRETSGVVLYAKTKECFESAVTNKKFADSIKTYLAIVDGTLKYKKSFITFPLPSRQNQRVMLKSKTRYKVLKGLRLNGVKASLVEAKIRSGRFHQIRLHFAMIHHPLLMDREYMDREVYKEYQKLLPLRHFFLHSYKIETTHFVTGKPLEIICPLPEDFEEIKKTKKHY